MIKYLVFKDVLLLKIFVSFQSYQYLFNSIDIYNLKDNSDLFNLFEYSNPFKYCIIYPF